SAVAARLGLRAVLALKGERPPIYDGNLLLDHLLGAELHYVSDAEFARPGEMLARLAEEVRVRGGRPYVIPESGSNEVGALGYLLDGYQGVGRARVGEAELSAVAKLAREEGVVLDPVYTAKAFAGLMDTLGRDPRALGQRVCFIHTGGIFSLFAYREALSQLL